MRLFPVCKSKPFLFPFLFLCILWGCSGLGKSVIPPRVNLVDLQVAEVKPLESTFQVEIRIINPNDFPLSVKGVEFDLELNDQRFGTGVSGQSATIAAFDSQVVPVVVYSSMINLVRGLIKLPQREQLTYKIEGSVRMADGTFTKSVPFENAGKIDLKHPAEPI
jgi:LEA14-like dessication related protein